MQSIYNFPAYYPLILKRKPEVVEQETAVLEKIFSEHTMPVKSVLELACGTMPHGRNLARHGYDVTGVDLSEDMLAEGMRLAEKENLSITTSCQNVIDFGLDGQVFDTAIFMFETFPLISRLDDLRNHFSSVHKHLNPGGLYIFDIDKVKLVERQVKEEWGHTEIIIPGGRLQYWYEDLPSELSEGVMRMALNCKIEQDQETICTRDEWTIRPHTTNSLKALADDMPGWRYIGDRNWKDGSQDISDVDHWFVLFQKV